MANKEIHILTCANNFFGQGMRVWQSMNLQSLRSELTSYGYSVSTSTYETVASNITSLRNAYILYSSTQKPGYKDYIEDVLLGLSNQGNHLIPRFDLFRSHENKGFQEILKQKLGIKQVSGRYFSHLEHSTSQTKDFPVILKEPSGSKSQSVFLVRNSNELRKRISQKEKLPLYWSIHKLLNYITLRKDPLKWYNYIKPYHRHVIQSFIPNLAHDFKVLGFGNKYFVLKRNVKTNSFKASGSGLLKFIEADNQLLNYAHDIHRKLNCPFVSLDIAETQESYSLLEFQAVNFGPTTLVKSPFHYIVKDGSWTKIAEKSLLEPNIAYSVHHHINKLTTNSE